MSEALGMEEESAGTRVAMPLCERTVSHEISEEVILPEERPEIRRVLSVRGRVLPPSRYVGSGNAEWNGSVEYTLLYVTGSGALCSATARADYGFGVPFESGMGEFDLGEGVCCFVSTVTDQLSARAMGSRRIRLRHRMRSRVRVYGQMLLAETLSGGEGNDTLQRRMMRSCRMRPVSVTSDGLPFEEELSLPSENTRVACVSGDVFITSVTPRDGSVAVTGEIRLSLLTERESGSMESVARKLPFEGTVESEELEAEMDVSLRGVLCGLGVSVENGRATCTGEVILTAHGMGKEPLLYTEDLYSTEREAVCEYAEYEIPLGIRCENRNVSISERVPVGDVLLPEGARILSVWGEPRLDGCEEMGGKYILNGVCRYSMLTEKDGEYGISEVSLPWRMETEGGEGTLTAWDGICEMIGCRGRVEGDLIYLDGELSVCVDYMGHQRIRAVSSVSLGETVERPAGRMIVYYPSGEETPWDVAKKYQVPVSELKGDVNSYFVF
jgi:hypothetical protein